MEEILTTDDARKIFADAGLNYSHLTRGNLQTLRRLINAKMVSSGCFDNTYRCKQRPIFQDKDRFWAAIRCKAYYFEDREAVSFNPDGFIGFGGWASSDNLKPILDGFKEWVGQLSALRSEFA